MIYTSKHPIILLFIFLIFSFDLHASAKDSHKIAVLVNEEIITSYDVKQRMKLSAILQKINITNENNSIIASNAIEELVNEKLKNEKANEYDIVIDNSEYINSETIFFEQNSYEKEDFLKLLELNEINYSEFKILLITELKWNKLISGLYFRLTSVSDIELEEVMSNNETITVENAKNFIIQKQLDLKSSKLLRDIINEATIEYR